MKMIKNLLWMFVALIVLSTGCKKEKKEVFATVTTTTATGITGSAAVTGGNITNTGNSAISQSGIVYATHATPILTDSLRANTSGGNTFTINLTALNANTVYYVRAFAINATGTTYGNQVTFTTSVGLATVTTTPIGTIAASTATGQSGGTIVNTGGATITASGVCWSNKPHPTITSSLTNDQLTNSTFTSTLSLLAANTTYYYRAYATNSFGTAYGNELSFNAGSTATVQDIDGNVYHTVTINGQTWMTENLRVTHYQNGDALVNGFANTSFDWSSATGAYTFPNGDTTNRATYGLLYNCPAVNDSRNIAPAGWHVATVPDWQKLEFYEGMSAADTVNTTGYVGAIDPLVEVGGSSGLNLQFPGAFTGGGYGLFGGAGFYWTSLMVQQQGGGAENWYREFYAPSNPSYPQMAQSYTSLILSIRCVKN